MNINHNNEIAEIFDDNKLKDLNRFIKKRECLNCFNFYMVYLFYLIQSAGILVTMIATSYNRQYLIWTGVGLNIFASLIHVYEKNNNTVLDNLLKDIKLIRDGKYIDEGLIVDLDTNKIKNNSHDNNSHNSNNSQGHNNSHA
jgi:hypothetical protein